jgi:hypothetical protein
MKKVAMVLPIIAKEVTTQHRIRMDVWTPSKRTAAENESFKTAAIDYYVRQHPTDQGLLKCMIINEFVRRDKVRGSHIWKWCTRGNGMEEFGLKPCNVQSPRNCMLLCESIAQAFDSKRVCFLIDRIKSDNIFLKVLDPALRSNVVTEGRPLTFDDIDGAQLQHPKNKFPYRRILDYHAKLSFQNAIDQNWLAEDASFTYFFDMSIDSSIPDLQIYQDFPSDDVDWNNDDFETFPMKSMNCSDGNEESSSQFLSQPPDHCCTKCLLSLNKSKFSKTQWKRRGKGAQCMVCIERRRR